VDFYLMITARSNTSRSESLAGVFSHGGMIGKPREVSRGLSAARDGEEREDSVDTSTTSMNLGMTSMDPASIELSANNSLGGRNGGEQKQRAEQKRLQGLGVPTSPVVVTLGRQALHCPRRRHVLAWEVASSATRMRLRRPACRVLGRIVCGNWNERVRQEVVRSERIKLIQKWQEQGCATSPVRRETHVRTYVK
jgi:hypothetical protein